MHVGVFLLNFKSELGFVKAGDETENKMFSLEFSFKTISVSVWC